jgi:AraC-like DNA-binding protein
VLSTADLPAELDEWARFSRWRDLMVENYGRHRAVPMGGRAFTARSEVAVFGPVGLAQHQATMSWTDRTAADIAADGIDNLLLVVNCGVTRIAFTQRGRETVLHPGSCALQSLSEPAHVRFTDIGIGEQSEWITVVVARGRLLELVPSAEDRVATLLDPAQPVMRHLRRYLDILFSPERADDPTLNLHIGTTLIDLVAVLLGAQGDAAEPAGLRGPRAARLREILGEINASFADPALTSGRVALKVGLSARYIQELLRQSGTSFTERVLERRLQHAGRMLMNRRHDVLKICDIAGACGFNEVSYFNRCFRRRFGASPTSWRTVCARKPPDLLA